MARAVARKYMGEGIFISPCLPNRFFQIDNLNLS